MDSESEIYPGFLNKLTVTQEQEHHNCGTGNSMKIDGSLTAHQFYVEPHDTEATKDPHVQN